MPEFTPEFEEYMRAVEAGERRISFHPPQRYAPSESAKKKMEQQYEREQSRRNAIAWADALRRERAKTTECQMPLCQSQTIRLNGVSLGICLACSYGVLDYWDNAADELKADETRLAMRERRVKRQLHEHYLGEKERESRRVAPGWIYYLLVADRIKIGYSTDVKRRLRAYPPDTPLLALHPGTKQLESEMHAKFAGSKGRRP